MYQSKTTPYNHQKIALAQMLGRKYFALFCDMGTGKSKIILDEIGELYTQGKIKNVLLLAPKGAYLNWQLSQIPTHFNVDNYSILTLRSTNTVRYEEQVHAFLLRVNKTDTLHIMIANIEAMSGSNNYLYVKAFVERAKELYVAIDESHTIKNMDSKRTKNLLKLAPSIAYRRILTGTPVTRNLLDLYSQCYWLEPYSLNRRGFYKNINHGYFTYRSEFCKLIQKGNSKRKFQIITGFKNLDILKERLKQFSFTIKKEDCLDLPEKIYTEQYVELTDEQKVYYNKIRESILIEFQNGGSQILIQNVLKRLSKLHQICCGHLKDDAGKVLTLETNRTKALLDLLEIHIPEDESVVSEDKIIIFYHFIHDREVLEKMCETQYKDQYVSYTGDQSQIDRFQNDDKCKIFLGSLHSASLGITLTAANYVIFYSNDYNYGNRIQSEDRAHRIGQNRKVTYIDLLTDSPVEKKILQSLRNKKDLADSLIQSDVVKLLGENV